MREMENVHGVQPMRNTGIARRWLVSGLAMGLLGTLCACGGSVSSQGSFGRVLNVSGPAELNLSNSNGRAIIRLGDSGQVRIHATFLAYGWTPEDARRHTDELAANPPIEQQGNMIRVGDKARRDYKTSVQYDIEVPKETEIRGSTGSGEIQITGIQGPVTLEAGSGDIKISSVEQDIKVTAGSGDIVIAGVIGDVDATADSGEITIGATHGEVRAHSGSGKINIAEPGGSVAVSTSSGGVHLGAVKQDARVQSSSGDIIVGGNPSGHSYWELQSLSGEVTLNVPADASFHFLAHSSSGKISSDIPMIAEESSSKRDLRAHLGNGDARIEVRTNSGNIHLQ